MVTVSDVYNYIDSIAPFKDAEPWDNCGLLVGEMGQPVSGVLVALDLNQGVLNQAAKEGVNLVVCHHPIIFEPLKSIKPNSICGQLIKHDVNVICAHTNLDVSGCGVNFCLGQALGLTNVRPLKKNIRRPCFLVSVFAPKESLKKVADAMNEAGAKRADSSSDYFFEGRAGAKGNLSTAKLGLEMFCRAEDLDAVLKAMRAAHPCREPEFSVVEDRGEGEYALSGIVGELAQELEAIEALEQISAKIGTDVLRYYFPGNKKIKTVACCGGAGAFMLKDAVAAGADLFITGDVKHSVWYLAENYGVGLADAGHFFTENLVVAELELRLSKKFKGITCKEAVNNTPIHSCWVSAGWSEQ